MTLQIEAFLDERGYAASSRESYRYILTRVGSWLVERGLTIDDLNAATYQQLLNSHPWSNNMKRLYGSALRAYLRWAGHPDHPIFAIPLPRDDAPPGRALDQAELRDLLASFDTTTPLGWRNLAMIALMVETGLRASEICRLDLSRVNMRKRKFTVQVKGKKRGMVRWREGIFSEDTARFLAIWLAERPKIAKKTETAVFVSVRGNRPGTRMTRGGLKALFRVFGERIGIGAFSPHDMRRTMAVLLTEAGAPTRLVQSLGGWDDIRMVVRYTQTLRPSQIDRYSPVHDMVDIELPAVVPTEVEPDP